MRIGTLSLKVRLAGRECQGGSLEEFEALVNVQRHSMENDKMELGVTTPAEHFINLRQAHFPRHEFSSDQTLPAICSNHR